LHIMNRALLTKLMWKWIHEQTWHTHHLYTNTNTIRPWLSAQATPFWKPLKQMDEFFTISRQIRIGNGKKKKQILA
jgi:hypothetical protein